LENSSIFHFLFKEKNLPKKFCYFFDSKEEKEITLFAKTKGKGLPVIFKNSILSELLQHTCMQS